MNSQFADFTEKLTRLGWRVNRLPNFTKLPETPMIRYSWLPPEVVSFLSSFDIVVSPSDTSWFVTCTDLREESQAAFSWNQWEIDSLAAAAGDIEWQRLIRAFWDDHFPLLLSVKSGYAYVAIRNHDHKIVIGEEPEFELTDIFEDGYNNFLQRVSDGDANLARWV